ncbi:MAG: sulfite exporter TauE/SafE family protein [Clostridiales bacterium]
MNGLILGLSSGTTCLIYCAPVLLPFLAGEGNNTKKNYIILGEFLLGRLSGYILFAIIAWFLGQSLVEITNFKEIIYGFTYIILSCFLIVYSFSKNKRICSMSFFKKFISSLQNDKNSYIPLITGFLTGINICPQFLIALTQASDITKLFGSIYYFFTFFIGTAVYFIPIPFIGFLKNYNFLKNFGKVAAVVVGTYYLYLGIITIYNYI